MGKKRKYNNHSYVLHIFNNDMYIEFELMSLRYKNIRYRFFI